MRDNFSSPWGQVQLPFLTFLQEKQIPVTVYLVNGMGLKGKIDNFDTRVVFLKREDDLQIIYKLNIASILPQTALN